jgi:hypothetical protein
MKFFSKTVPKRFSPDSNGRKESTEAFMQLTPIVSYAFEMGSQAPLFLV